MQPVTVAVIAAAGSASRMWPTSKAVPKELFPLGRMPAVGYLLGELYDAGVRRVIFVIGPTSIPLVRALDPGNPPPPKVAMVPEVVRFQQLITHMELEFLYQSGPYGNGTPLRNALDRVGERPCIYAFSDDIVLGECVSAKLIERYHASGAPVLAAQPVPRERTSSFGIIECDPTPEGLRLRRFIEKPPPGATDSNLATFGRYLVTPELGAALRDTGVGKDGELWFADAIIARLNAGAAVYAEPLTEGRWYTVGDPVGYAEAVAAATRG